VFKRHLKTFLFNTAWQTVIQHFCSSAYWRCMLIISYLFWCNHGCRRYQLLLHHAVHSRDVHQDVRGWLPGILRLHVQPVWLHRHHLQLDRGGAHLLQGHEPDRLQRSQMRATATRLQSHQVSHGLTYAGILCRSVDFTFSRHIDCFAFASFFN